MDPIQEIASSEEAILLARPITALPLLVFDIHRKIFAQYLSGNLPFSLYTKNHRLLLVSQPNPSPKSLLAHHSVHIHQQRLAVVIFILFLFDSLFYENSQASHRFQKRGQKAGRFKQLHELNKTHVVFNNFFFTCFNIIPCLVSLSENPVYYIPAFTRNGFQFNWISHFLRSVTCVRCVCGLSSCCSHTEYSLNLSRINECRCKIGMCVLYMSFSLSNTISGEDKWHFNYNEIDRNFLN